MCIRFRGFSVGFRNPFGSTLCNSRPSASKFVLLLQKKIVHLPSKIDYKLSWHFFEICLPQHFVPIIQAIYPRCPPSCVQNPHGGRGLEYTLPKKKELHTKNVTHATPHVVTGMSSGRTHHSGGKHCLRKGTPLGVVCPRGLAVHTLPS